MDNFFFTSLTTSLFVNDKTLNGIFEIGVHERLDDPSNSVYIRIKRHVAGDDYLVNYMRSSNRFSLRMINNMNSGGYVTEEAEMEQFEMGLPTEASGAELFLEQTLTIKAPSFFYQADARSEAMKVADKKDIDDLISIIKENKARAVFNAPAAVLPEEKKKDKKKKKKHKDKD